MTSDIADNLGLDRPVGALVSDVARSSPAAEAGIKAGDVILAIGKQAIDDNEAFGFRFATMPLGGSVDLSVRRQGKTLTASVKLIAAPGGGVGGGGSGSGGGRGGESTGDDNDDALSQPPRPPPHLLASASLPPLPPPPVFAAYSPVAAMTVSA